MITHRSTDGYRNSVAAIDGKYMITNVDELRYEVMYSDTEILSSFNNSMGWRQAVMV